MTDTELEAIEKAWVDNHIGTHWDGCHLVNRHHGCAVAKLLTEVRKQRREIAEWTNAARKVFKGPTYATCQEEWDAEAEKLEAEGMAALNELMLGNGWCHLESESTLSHMVRRMDSAEFAARMASGQLERIRQMTGQVRHTADQVAECNGCGCISATAEECVAYMKAAHAREVEQLQAEIDDLKATLADWAER